MRQLLAASWAHVLSQRAFRWSFCFIVYEGDGSSLISGKYEPYVFSFHFTFQIVAKFHHTGIDPIALGVLYFPLPKTLAASIPQA
jgi:hypothetical protein